MRYEDSKGFAIICALIVILVAGLGFYSIIEHEDRLETAIECIAEEDYTVVIDGIKIDGADIDVSGLTSNSYVVYEIDNQDKVVYLKHR